MVQLQVLGWIFKLFHTKLGKLFLIDLALWSTLCLFPELLPRSGISVDWNIITIFSFKIPLITNDMGTSSTVKEWNQLKGAILRLLVFLEVTSHKSSFIHGKALTTQYLDYKRSSFGLKKTLCGCGFSDWCSAPVHRRCLFASWWDLLYSTMSPLF